MLAPLGPYPDVATTKKYWFYALVIGMIIYLVTNAIIEVYLAVNKCAQFTHDNKENNECHNMSSMQRDTRLITQLWGKYHVNPWDLD